MCVNIRHAEVSVTPAKIILVVYDLHVITVVEPSGVGISIREDPLNLTFSAFTRESVEVIRLLSWLDSRIISFGRSPLRVGTISDTTKGLYLWLHKWATLYPSHCLNGTFYLGVTEVTGHFQWASNLYYAAAFLHFTGYRLAQLTVPEWNKFH